MRPNGDQAKNVKGQAATPDHSVRYAKGVGPVRQRLLERLGVRTIEELLCLFPRRYEDRSQIIPLKTACERRAAEEKVLVEGVIDKTSLFRTRTGVRILKVMFSDKTGNGEAVWFNSEYLKDQFKTGERVFFFGKMDPESTSPKMIHPEYDLPTATNRGVNTGRIVPFYPLTQDLTQRSMRSVMYQLLVDVLPKVVDVFPEALRTRHNLTNSRYAIKEIHFPTAVNDLEAAYRRLVFDEFFYLQLAVARKKSLLKSAEKPKAVSERTVNEFKSLLPFEPTEAQMSAFEDIRKDLSSSRLMHRLIQGDVGSGKTTIAAFALYATAVAGEQGALMAPTDILAQQHYLTLSRLFGPRGIQVELLAHGQSKPERERVLTAIHDGSCRIVVGTHALIQKGVEFKRLGMIVIDEQHKFGVFQRDFLKEKSKKPHLLVMTATPIPQTLSMTLYGDLDVTVMKGAPKGRGEIKTLLIDSSGRSAIHQEVKKTLKEGRQAYVVYPAADVAAAEIQSAAQSAEAMRKEFKDYKVEILHGKLKPEEKKKIMKEFRENKTQMLLATTVIEVGVDVPNATWMLIENAERFGLSQLHQLRGRIGRGSHDSTCVLLSDSEQEIALDRLSAFTRLESGFEIAEHDLKLRGPGDVLGARQHGVPEMRIGDLIKDASILEAARKEAFAIIDADPELHKEEHKLMQQKLKKKFGDKA